MEQWQVGPVPEYIYNSTNHPNNDMHQAHPYPPHMQQRRDDQMGGFRYGAPHPPQGAAQQHHPGPGQPTMNAQQHAQQQQHVQQQHAQQQHAQQQHAQQPQQHQQPHPPQSHVPPPQAAQPQQKTPTPAPAPAPRSRKRAAPAAVSAPAPVPPPPQPPVPVAAPPPPVATPIPPPTPTGAAGVPKPVAQPVATDDSHAIAAPPPAKKSRTNTPWTPAEELRLKQMRDAGNSWAEIAKTFPTRTEGSVKKHWYKDMHYAEFAEDESQALLNAIKEYENNKWKVIGQKVGKPAKACEQYAKEHFADQFPATNAKR